jgi:hypothetical protein
MLVWRVLDRATAFPEKLAVEAWMIRVVQLFLAKGYERLFSRRFGIENECGVDANATGDLPLRRRFSVAGAIFPTDTKLPRYQY